MDARSRQIRQLLERIDAGEGDEGGDAQALLPLVYEQLRARAARLMGRERRDHTLQRTALIHEAYLEIAQAGLSFQSRLHFLNAATCAMRRILVDHAVARKRLKRGGARARVSLDEGEGPAEDADQLDWIALDEALEELARVSPRQAQVVSLRFFAGLPEREIAQVLGVGESTVRSDWATARPWLYQRMRDG